MALQIDVQRIIENRSPKLARHLPTFAMRWLKKTIHQDEMNEFLRLHGEENAWDFVGHVLQMLNAQLEICNPENISQTGRPIFVSNHPLGGLDGLCYLHVLSSYRKDVKVPVNDLLMQVPPLREVFIPINKFGRQSRDAVRSFNETFASNDAILYFPAGLCSRRQHGTIRDLTWKSTIITKAVQYQRDIIPCHFQGQNSNFFYRLAQLRNFLHIKTNIEQLFLVDEMYRQKNHLFTITFGQPISYQYFTSQKTPQQWAHWLQEQTYQLTSKK